MALDAFPRKHPQRRRRRIMDTLIIALCNNAQLAHAQVHHQQNANETISVHGEKTEKHGCKHTHTHEGAIFPARLVSKRHASRWFSCWKSGLTTRDIWPCWKEDGREITKTGFIKTCDLIVTFMNISFFSYFFLKFCFEHTFASALNKSAGFHFASARVNKRSTYCCYVFALWILPGVAIKLGSKQMCLLKLNRHLQAHFRRAPFSTPG